MACSHKRSCKRSGGFTLLELLVAISIMALVAVMGWRGLDGIVRARVALSSDMEATRRMQLTFAQLQSDCARVAPVAALGGRQVLAAEDGRLTLIRTVEIEGRPLGFEVVSYRIANGVLHRRESSITRDLHVLDQMWQAALGDGSGGADVNLQTDVAVMRLRAWVDDAWLPVAGADLTAATPNALEVQVKLTGHAAGMTKAMLLGAG